MSEQISLVIKVIYGNDILVDSIVYIWNFKIAFFFADLNIFKILHGIISDKTKQPMIYEFVVLAVHLKLRRKGRNGCRNIDIWGNGLLSRAAIRVIAVDLIISDLDAGNWVATDIAKTVVVSMIVATFQKQAVWEPIPQLQIDRNRR